MASHLERLDGSCAPACLNVMDMLGQRAAYLSRADTDEAARMWEIYVPERRQPVRRVQPAARGHHASMTMPRPSRQWHSAGFIWRLIICLCARKLQGWKWLASVVLVFGILIVPGDGGRGR